MKLITTTTYAPSTKMIERAKEIANILRVPYEERGKFALNQLKKNSEVDFLIVVQKDKEIITDTKQSFFFHPNLAKLRIKALSKGERDHMLEALDLFSGDTLLDCTLGLAADAIVASYRLGQEGKVIGLESNPVISLLVTEGLQKYTDNDKDLVESMARIKVINTDYLLYLESLTDKSLDVVYFDPMFRCPIDKSDAIGAIRQLANKKPVDLASIRQALRVARKRVVLKERCNSKEFERLGFSRVIGGKYSSVAYGIIEVVN